MSFVGGRGGAPIEAIDGRFVKEERQILVQGGLILLDKEKIVSSSSNDLPTNAPLRVKRISTDQAPLEQEWSEEIPHASQFIFFLDNHLLFEHNTRFRLV
jgi:hypothetical protein